MIHVLRERAGVTEPLQTFVTLERLLTTMQTFVFGQMMFVLKRLRANITLVWALT